MTRERWLLVALVALPTLLVQLARPVPRIDADAVEYFSHLRSLYFDHDVEFGNEYAHFGILGRRDRSQPTVTGHHRTTFSVGPALLWLPFYAAGDVVARAVGDVEDGYSDAHIRAVALGSLVYAVWGVLLLHGVLRDLAGRSAALWASVLTYYGTFLCFYTAIEPIMSHACSFFAAALVLRVWWKGRDGLSPRRALALGLVVGVAGCVRWQNVLLLLLPAATTARAALRNVRAAFGVTSALVAATLLGLLPQMLVWKAIFGSYWLADPPQGRDFVRLEHPFLLETLFSSRHGLLFWTPLLWAGYLGLTMLLRRRPFVAAAVGLPLLLMTYINACSGDWWAGGSFSNRRFDSALPLVALGIVVMLERWSAAVARHPAVPVCGTLLVLTLYNGLLMQQFRQNLIPRDDVVSFPRLAENSAALVAESVGTPLAWPANWLFARQHRTSPAGYDLAAGKYLFYRQNNLGGSIDLGDDRADPALLLEGWARQVPCEEAVCRTIEGRARLLVPLDVPEDLDLAVRARGEGSLRVLVNGRALAELPLAERLTHRRARIPGNWLHREANEIELVATAGTAQVDTLVFDRVAVRGTQ